MSDQPEMGVAEAPPAMMDRIANLFGADEPEQDAPETEQAAPEQEVEAAADDQATSDEVTADDLPAEPQAQSLPDQFEIEWNGEKRVLPRDEIIQLAQKGFDYTQKTQALGEERNRVIQMTQALNQAAQLQAALVDDIGEFKAIQRELGRFPQTPEQWMQASQADPLGAFQQQTQYNALLQHLNAVGTQLQTKAQQLSRGQAGLTTEQLRGEFAKVQERIPAWRDEAAFKKDAAGIKAFLASEGATEADLNGIERGWMLSALYKGWKYDQLVKAKGEKLKQVRSAAPVMKPGVAAKPGDTGKAQQATLKDGIKTAKGEKAKAAAIEKWLHSRM